MKAVTRLMVFGLAGLAGAALATEAGFERMRDHDYRILLKDAHAAYQKKDFPRAFELYHRNACGGDKPSQFALGGMYLMGQGTSADAIQAYAWIKTAAESGSLEYIGAAEKLESALPAEHRSAASEAARTTVARYGTDATHIQCAQKAGVGSHIAHLDCKLPVESRTGLVEVKMCL